MYTPIDSIWKVEGNVIYINTVIRYTNTKYPHIAAESNFIDGKLTTVLDMKKVFYVTDYDGDTYTCTRDTTYKLLLTIVRRIGYNIIDFNKYLKKN